MATNQGEVNYYVPPQGAYFAQQDVTQQHQQQAPIQPQPYMYPPQIHAPQVYAQPVPQPVYAQGMGMGANLQHGPDGRCCGCKNTCCNPYLHMMMLLMLAISLISCFVSLTGELHYITLEKSTIKTTTSYFRDHQTSAGLSISYNNLPSSYPTSDCASAGSALLAAMILSIFTILFSLLATTLRVFNKGPAVFKRHAILLEMLGIGLSLVLFGIANAMWGLRCFKKTADWANQQTSFTEYTLVATGYSYLDASTILILASLVHILAIRNNPYFRNYGRVDAATLLGHMQQPAFNQAGYVPVPDHY